MTRILRSESDCTMLNESCENMDLEQRRAELSVHGEVKSSEEGAREGE